MQNVFIIGSKGIPGNYGGYETFVDKLTEHHADNDKIKYHVACKNAEKEEYYYNKARCFSVRVPNIGSAQAVIYDIRALKSCCSYIEKNRIKHAVVYVLACRIGPWFGRYVRRIHKSGGTVMLNPDGHEWKRSKWNSAIRRYWKLSERLMVKHSDFIVCDSINIEKYINKIYNQYNPRTTYISYGAEITGNVTGESEEKYKKWLDDKGVKEGEYYLIVGRFVPENNYETMIKEFMESGTDKQLVIITTANDKLYSYINSRIQFEKDRRIKFAGTVYDAPVLYLIRKNAYGYIHGHEVGGTNPSLLEALAATKLNLLLKVSFNKEAGRNAALYWTKDKGSLSSLIDRCDNFDASTIEEYSQKAKEIISSSYSWEYICSRYEKIFTTKQ